MTDTVTILVVDDFEPTALLLKQIFEKAGFKILKAGTVAEGVALARSAKPDLILMDVVLPDGSGLDAVRILRRFKGTAKVPIIAMSGKHLSSMRRDALDAGCSDFIPKPFKIYDLTWRIQNWLTHEEQPAPTA